MNNLREVLNGVAGVLNVHFYSTTSGIQYAMKANLVGFFENFLYFIKSNCFLKIKFN